MGLIRLPGGAIYFEDNWSQGGMSTRPKVCSKIFTNRVISPRDKPRKDEIAYSVAEKLK